MTRTADTSPNDIAEPFELLLVKRILAAIGIRAVLATRLRLQVRIGHRHTKTVTPYDRYSAHDVGFMRDTGPPSIHSGC